MIPHLVRFFINSKPLINILRSDYNYVYNRTFLTGVRKLCASCNDFYSNVDYDAITKGDEELSKKLKVIMLEMEVVRQEGGRVPDKISTEKWIELLHAHSRSQRFKNLSFWWLNEKKRENDKEKKAQKRAIREESKDLRKEVSHIWYGFGGSTIFIRIYESTIDKWRNYKLTEAMLFNQPLILDCGYESHMNNAELGNCAKQLLILFSENRNHRDPFNLYFCNAPRDNRIIKKLHKLVPTLFEPDFPLNVTEKSYLEMFPKEKLVYLTPHCREELKEYNHDDIYIIGAMVDKTNIDPLSLAKAKAEGLRMAKFPLDRYLDWAIGTKSLTINQSLNIMLDLKLTKDWEKALEHVPRRKLRGDEDPTEIEESFGKPTEKGFDRKAYRRRMRNIFTM